MTFLTGYHTDRLKLNNATAHNIILLQWLVVEGFQRCNLKLLFRQTCLMSSDSPPLQAIKFRYMLLFMISNNNSQ
jgi:hypothetical protein